jgi:hypothetical protein
MRPDQATILEGVARFLEQDLRGAIKDPGLAFRVLVAANLCRVAAAERRTVPDRGAELAAMNAAIAERVRSGACSAFEIAAITAEVKRGLAATLKVTNPRFDLGERIE